MPSGPRYRHDGEADGEGDGAGEGDGEPGEDGDGDGEPGAGEEDEGRGDGDGWCPCRPGGPPPGAEEEVPGRGWLLPGGPPAGEPEPFRLGPPPGATPNCEPGPLACGGRMLSVTAAVMMYTRVAATTMMTGGSSSRGWARKATAPLRRVDLIRSLAMAKAMPPPGKAGPYPMLALRRARIRAARRSGGVRPGAR